MLTDDCYKRGGWGKATNIVGEIKVPDSPRSSLHNPGPWFWIPIREMSQVGISIVKS